MNTNHPHFPPSASNALRVVVDNDRPMNVSDDVLDAGEGVTRLGSTQTLEPGYHWTALREVGGDGKADSHFNVGETLLLVDVVEFENRVHSVKLRMHPRHGERTFTVMVEDFVKAFDPCLDAEPIRQREQKEIMDRVAAIQNELMRTQMDPQMMIEAVRGDVEREIADSDRTVLRETRRESEQQVEREKNLEKIHRRASRRSAAKGNPLAVPKATLASEVGAIISCGIDASGVAELARMAGRQAIIAKAQGNWLEKKTKEISHAIAALTPFMSERAAVALARSSGALKMAERIKSGIESLDLYTGKGVDVFDVCTGREAPSSEPLTLIQGKKFMDEELAVWADVDADFDFSSKESFFKALADNTGLRDQVLPAPRCVVTMAVLRRPRDYGGDALTSIMRNQQNQLVFLLVRNGENVHVVYSAAPSHEAASRLFPTRGELEQPFRGWDGGRVSIRDIEFGKAAAAFDNIALCYKRFLILLCGLDHRLKLMGDFYPAHEQMAFMTAGFQERHFNFIADDDASGLLGDDRLPLSTWMAEHNRLLQSGSRVFLLSGGASKSAAEFKRRSTLQATPGQFKDPFIALKEGARFIVRLHARDRYSHDEVHAKCELDSEGGSVSHGSSSPWWLCVDAVDLKDVQRYRFSRIHRAMGVGYLRLMRRVESFLIEESSREQAARSYLLETAVGLGGVNARESEAMLDTAVRNWRAARRGLALPGVNDKSAMHEVLNLMVPEGRLPGEMQRMLESYLAGCDAAPLLVSRSGKSKLLLYVAPSHADKEPYPDVLTWGWAKRITLEAGKTKLREVSSTLLWLGTALPASETEVKRWDAAKAWMHEAGEPVGLRRYGQLPALLKNAETCWVPILKAGQGGGLPEELFDALTSSIDAVYRKSRAVDSVLLHLPVGVTGEGDGRTLQTAYLKCRAESALCFYGNKAQSDATRERYVQRYVNKAKARERVSRMDWSLVCSAEELTIAHDQATDKNVTERPAWAQREIKACLKGRDFFNKSPKKPRWDQAKVSLSLNRAFEELMQVSTKGPKRAFYQEVARAIADEKRYPFRTQEERKERIKALAKRRFEGGMKAQCSELVWSQSARRSTANAHFKRALESKSKAA